jgi:hypothetical protein
METAQPQGGRNLGWGSRMRSRRVALVAVVAVAGVFAASGGEAGAERQVRRADADSSGATPQANAQLTRIRDGQGAVGGGGARKSSLRCERYAAYGGGLPGHLGARGGLRDADKNGGLQEGDLYVLVCYDAAGNEVVNELRRYDPSAPAAPPVDPKVLAQEAKQDLALPLPGVQTSPPPEHDQLVNLPSWLWVEDWSPRSATASVPGVSSTVTATPTKVVWDMGNGDQVVCRGPGKPYDLSLKEHQQSSDCTYTYRASSAGQPGQRYQASATMTWSVSWTASGAPGGGDLGEASRTTTFSMRVAEGQALVSEAG